jgi:hypothetical protein
MANTVYASVAVEIAANVSKLVGGVKQAQTSLAGLASAAKTANGLLTTFGVGFAGYKLFQAFRDSVGILANFEHSMQEVRAITGATGQQFRDLREDAVRLGSSTKFTATQVAALQTAYGRLGFNTKEILDATSATLDLAAATGEDLAKSADVAGSTVRAFLLEADETQRVVDVMASSFNKSALQLDNFQESMKFVATVAASANVSLEETTALLSVLADAGIRGSQAGTSLKRIITDLSKDGRPLSERLQELADRGLTFSGAMDEVGRIAQASLLVLSKNTEKVADLTNVYKHANGEAAKMARIMQDDLTGDVIKLTSAWEGLIITMGDTKFFRDTVQQLTNLVNTLSGSGPSIDKVFSDIAYVLTQSGDLINFTTKDIQGNLKQYVEQLKNIRRETGKPIDLSQVEFLAEKYNLSSKAAQFLRLSIEEANTALSFQERAVKRFNDFASANGYEDLNQGAQAYIAKINQLIIAETNRQQNFKQTAIDLNTDAFKGQIARSEEQIAVWLREIDIIKQLSSSWKTAQAEISEVTERTVLNLRHYRDVLKGLNEAFDDVEITRRGADSADISRLRVIASQIQGYTDLIKTLDSLKDSFKDTQFILKPVDTTALLNPIQEIKKSIGGIEFSTFSTLFDEVAARFEAKLKQMANAAGESTKSIKESFIDLSGPIGSALSGIGQAIGGAIAGTENFGKAILQVVAGFAKNLGEILIATGVGMLAAQKLLKNPYTAIVAGIALVAISAAASSAISKSHSSSFGGSGGSGGSGVTVAERNNVTTGVGQTINFEGKFVIEGDKLVSVLNNADFKRNITG